MKILNLIVCLTINQFKLIMNFILLISFIFLLPLFTSSYDYIVKRFKITNSYTFGNLLCFIAQVCHLIWGLFGIFMAYVSHFLNNVYEQFYKLGNKIISFFKAIQYHISDVVIGIYQEFIIQLQFIWNIISSCKNFIQAYYQWASNYSTISKITTGTIIFLILLFCVAIYLSYTILS